METAYNYGNFSEHHNIKMYLTFMQGCSSHNIVDRLSGMFSFRAENL